MQDNAGVYKRILQNPRFSELARKRRRLSLTLTALVLACYYALMMLVAFAPDTLHKPLAEGGTLTVGIPIGAVIIIGSWLLTGWFVARANGEFDRINEELIREASK